MIQPLIIIVIFLALLLGYLAWIVVASRQELKTHRTYRRKADDNKKTVIDFYDLAFNKKDMDAAAKFLDDDYIQHNPAGTHRKNRVYEGYRAADEGSTRTGKPNSNRLSRKRTW